MDKFHQILILKIASYMVDNTSEGSDTWKFLYDEICDFSDFKDFIKYINTS